MCTLLGDGYYDPPLNILLSRKDAWAQAVGAVSEVADHAADKGVNVSVELLQGSIVNRVPLLLRLIEEVGQGQRPGDGGYRHVLHHGQAVHGRPARRSERSAILSDIVHVKDEIGLPSIVQTNHTWMGGGLVDFAEVREALDEIDFGGVLQRRVGGLAGRRQHRGGGARGLRPGGFRPGRC